jgi:hypothetical protein
MAFRPAELGAQLESGAPLRGATAAGSLAGVPARRPQPRPTNHRRSRRRSASGRRRRGRRDERRSPDRRRARSRGHGRRVRGRPTRARCAHRACRPSAQAPRPGPSSAPAAATGIPAPEAARASVKRRGRDPVLEKSSARRRRRVFLRRRKKQRRRHQTQAPRRPFPDICSQPVPSPARTWASTNAGADSVLTNDVPFASNTTGGFRLGSGGAHFPAVRARQVRGSISG